MNYKELTLVFLATKLSGNYLIHVCDRVWHNSLNSNGCLSKIEIQSKIDELKRHHFESQVKDLMNSKLNFTKFLPSNFLLFYFLLYFFFNINLIVLYELLQNYRERRGGGDGGSGGGSRDSVIQRWVWHVPKLWEPEYQHVREDGGESDENDDGPRR